MILSGNAILRRQSVWIAKIWTKLQRPEARSLSKNIEMPFILQRSWGRVVHLQFSPSTAFFLLLVVGQLYPGPISVSGKVVPNYCSILPQSSLKFSAPKFSCTDDFFLLKNRASLFHSSELSGLLGDIVLLTAFCCWFCNSSNTVCFHHFVAYASKKPSCYQWMDSGYSLYLDHVFIWIFNRCKSLRYYYSSLNSRQTPQACQSFSR